MPKNTAGRLVSLYARLFNGRPKGIDHAEKSICLP